MSQITNSLNAKAAAINIANILSSQDSRIRQNALILVLNPASPWFDESGGADGNSRQDARPSEIKITLDGEILIDGKKINIKKPPSGYRIFVDRKEARS